MEAINTILNRDPNLYSNTKPQSTADGVWMSHRNPLTVFLPDLQQHRLPQVDGEGFVLLILLIVNDLHLQDFPVVDKDIKIKCSIFSKSVLCEMRKLTVAGKSK